MQLNAEIDKAAIIVEPLVSRIDQPVRISVRGARPHANITLKLQREVSSPSQAYTLQSHATFCVSSTGTLDLDMTEPMSGTYSGVDGMGLFWSMEIVHIDERMSLDYVKVAPQVFTITLEIDQRVVDCLEFKRLWFDEQTIRMPVREAGLVGTFFYSNSLEKRPGLLVVGGSEGGIYEFPAALFAAHGFNVLALGYWGVEHLPQNLANIPLEYIEKAIEWLKGNPYVEAGWLGMHGTSRGGELALWSAALFPDIKAVVALNSSPVTFAGIVPWSDEPTLPPAWVYKGDALPYCTRENPVDVALECKKLYQQGRNGLRKWYDTLSIDQEQAEKALVPVERIQGSILFICGDADANFDVVTYNQMAYERLRQYEHPYENKLLIYPGAGHELGIPNIRISCNEFTGGDRNLTATASRKSWQETIDFFKRSL